MMLKLVRYILIIPSLSVISSLLSDKYGLWSKYEALERHSQNSRHFVREIVLEAILGTNNRKYSPGSVKSDASMALESDDDHFKGILSRLPENHKYAILRDATPIIGFFMNIVPDIVVDECLEAWNSFEWHKPSSRNDTSKDHAMAQMGDLSSPVLAAMIRAYMHNPKRNPILVRDEWLTNSEVIATLQEDDMGSPSMFHELTHEQLMRVPRTHCTSIKIETLLKMEGGLVGRVFDGVCLCSISGVGLDARFSRIIPSLPEKTFSSMQGPFSAANARVLSAGQLRYYGEVYGAERCAGLDLGSIDRSVAASGLRAECLAGFLAAYKLFPTRIGAEVASALRPKHFTKMSRLIRSEAARGLHPLDKEFLSGEVLQALYSIEEFALNIRDGGSIRKDIILSIRPSVLAAMSDSEAVNAVVLNNPDVPLDLLAHADALFFETHFGSLGLCIVKQMASREKGPIFGRISSKMSAQVHFKPENDKTRKDIDGCAASNHRALTSVSISDASRVEDVRITPGTIQSDGCSSSVPRTHFSRAIHACSLIKSIEVYRELEDLVVEHASGECLEAIPIVEFFDCLSDEEHRRLPRRIVEQSLPEEYFLTWSIDEWRASGMRCEYVCEKHIGYISNSIVFSMTPEGLSECGLSVFSPEQIGSMTREVLDAVPDWSALSKEQLKYIRTSLLTANSAMKMSAEQIRVVGSENGIEVQRSMVRVFLEMSPCLDADRMNAICERAAQLDMGMHPRCDLRRADSVHRDGGIPSEEPSIHTAVDRDDDEMSIESASWDFLERE
jgi:hypothetical protein